MPGLPASKWIRPLRVHAATKPATLGLVLIVIGASLQLADTGDSVKLFLVVVFQFVTAPIAAHLIGRAAYRSVVEVAETIAIDELAGDSVDEV
jgi:multicomponent Na+:H+ antiporter subunit G